MLGGWGLTQIDYAKPSRKKPRMRIVQGIVGVALFDQPLASCRMPRSLLLAAFALGLEPPQKASRDSSAGIPRRSRSDKQSTLRPQQAMLSHVPRGGIGSERCGASRPSGETVLVGFPSESLRAKRLRSSNLDYIRVGVNSRNTGAWPSE